MHAVRAGPLQGMVSRSPLDCTEVKVLADGALSENQAFCAHPKFVAGTGRLCAFSLGLRGAEGGQS